MDDILEFDIEYELKNLVDEASLVDEDELPISKKMTKSFRRFYLETVLFDSLTVESPQRRTFPDEVSLETSAYNISETRAYINGEKGEFVEYFSFNGYNVSIYKKESNEKNLKITEYPLIFNEKECKITFGFVRIIQQDINGQTYFFTRGIWNSRTDAIGLIFSFFTKWLLPKYKMIISDNLTTTLGEGFWLKIAKYGLANSKECGIYIDPKILKSNNPSFKSLIKIEDFSKAWEKPATMQRIYIKE